MKRKYPKERRIISSLYDFKKEKELIRGLLEYCARSFIQREAQVRYDESVKRAINPKLKRILESVCRQYKHDFKVVSKKQTLDFHNRILIDVHRAYRSSIPIEKKETRGRPQLSGEFSIVLLWGLKKFSGDRKSIDWLGEYISQKGDFKKILEGRFGFTHYDKIKLPQIHNLPTRPDRWENMNMKGIKSAAERFVKVELKNEETAKEFLEKVLDDDSGKMLAACFGLKVDKNMDVYR